MGAKGATHAVATVLPQVNGAWRLTRTEGFCGKRRIKAMHGMSFDRTIGRCIEGALTRSGGAVGSGQLFIYERSSRR